MKDIKFIAMCKDIFMIIKINIPVYEIIFRNWCYHLFHCFLLLLTFQFLHNMSYLSYYCINNESLKVINAYMDCRKTQCQHRINHIKQLMMNQAQNLDSFKVPCTKVETLTLSNFSSYTFLIYIYGSIIFFSIS